MSNRLKDEKSPYLLQHGDNPVDWYPWGNEAFQKAIREDKPVFLSIGYSTCHWCHVMAHESFEDGEVAGLLNENYVCIKVDREERPDIDAVYMSVCQMMTGGGGWPLTILMTPAQKPFFAGTYFPKRSHYGHPGLLDILKGISGLWKNNREALINAGEEITAALRQEGSPKEQEPDRSILNHAYALFQKAFDRRWGGFGAAPKFPVPHNLLFLMRYAALEEAKASEALQMVEKTLDAMAKGGIHDHIGGGFSRYSTDERWLVPHFEKMLYDNALLILAYTEAYQITGQKQYAEIARRTADYILRELTDETGGFYCGQDADSDGVEGKYYVFTPEEIALVLGNSEGKIFCVRYGITEKGNFEGKSIPNLIGESSMQRYEADEQKLYQYRLGRTELHKDDKILLSWNAWTMLALVKAGRILKEEKYLKAAAKAENFIRENMTDAQNRLYLRFRKGEAANPGQLEDYAVYALALLELYQTDFQIKYLEEALFRAEQMLTYFEDAKKSGFYKAASDAETLIARPKETDDGAVPSGNSVAAMVLHRLAMLTGARRWQEASDRQMRYLAGELRNYPAGHGFALLAMADTLDSHKELICAARDGVPEELKDYLKDRPAYGLNVLVKTEENAERLAKCAPFTEEYPLPEQGAFYYLCENGTCRVPVTDLCRIF
ncbi:MAG: thioredoxin domain-containing protein [Lachnospiraceae bacterium]|nr:thioredoxin domain-containing protein [Lachnospiraceae bacterium]